MEVGERFGRLVLIAPGKFKASPSEWRCYCGNFSVATYTNVSRGHTKSCGCLAIETRTIHGQYETPTYASWKAMRTRCSPNNKKYRRDYFERGIYVCERWMESFENFLEDMGGGDQRVFLLIE